MSELNEHEYEMDGPKRITALGVGDVRTVEVEVTETLKRVIEVEIPYNESPSFALEVVGQMYDNQEFCLDSDDYEDTSIGFA